MGTNSDDLGAQLFELKRAGRHYLPEMAWRYTQASRDLHNTGFYDNAENPAFGSIAALRDMLQTIMGETCNSFVANGKALISIAEDYAATDKEAAREMKARWEEYMGDPEFKPPKEPVPDPKHPDDNSYEVRIETREWHIFPHMPESRVEYEVEVPVR